MGSAAEDFTRSQAARSPVPSLLLGCSLLLGGCGLGATDETGTIVFGLEWDETRIGNARLLTLSDDPDNICDGELEEMLQLIDLYRQYLGVNTGPVPDVFIARFPNGTAPYKQLLQGCGERAEGCASAEHVFGRSSSISHELVHFAAEELAATSGLFSEGLASALSCNPFNGLFEPPHIGWRDMANFVIERPSGDDTRHYYWSGRFITSLILRFGIENFTDFYRLLDGIHDNETFATRFLNTYGESLDQAWETAHQPEYAQGCIPVAECQRPLPRENRECYELAPGGLLTAGQAYHVEVQANFGAYACSGRGAEMRPPRLVDERAWIYSEEDIALVLWADLELGSVTVLGSELRADAECADLTLELEADEDSHVVVMPPIQDFVLELKIDGPLVQGEWDFDWGSWPSIGYDYGEWSDDAPLLVRQFEDCSDLEANLPRENWPVGDGGLFRVQAQEVGPYIFEVTSINPP